MFVYMEFNYYTNKSSNHIDEKKKNIYADVNSDIMIDGVLSAIRQEKKENESSDSTGNYDGL